MLDILTSKHQQHFWGKSSPQIYCQRLTATQNDAPDVWACFSLDDEALCLSYAIKRAEWLGLDALPTSFDEAVRQDYLWEQNCLECFVGFGQSDYLEMNFSPTGAFNLYRFDDYRSPDVMPPAHAQGSLDATADHQDCFLYHIRWQHHRDDVKCVNPCVILYQDEQPIFYAHQHANPPDFHDKTFWLDLANV